MKGRGGIVRYERFRRVLRWTCRIPLWLLVIAGSLCENLISPWYFVCTNESLMSEEVKGFSTRVPFESYNTQHEYD